MTDGLGRGLVAGAVGAGVLTAIHQIGRATLDDPPRMDVVGRRALQRGAKPFGVRLQRREAQRWTLAGDLVANALYYALVTRGSPAAAPWRGALLGALAGVGGVFLPERLGLGSRPSRATGSTALLTVAWYAIGGLAAGLAARRMSWEAGDPDLHDRLTANMFV
ncbi:MAG TPA: hypothetical protein VFK85_16900 [Anaeromyxobacteraceae bacterium]|nr:hypothetical protein [Anaeromyxobacteraceae bacterium]